MHPFILSCSSYRRMEWSGCAWVIMIGKGVDVFPFNECGKYVENMRPNMPSTKNSRKKVENQVFKKKNSSIPMHDTNGKAGALRSLNIRFYWLLCLSFRPLSKKLSLRALALTRSRQDFTLARRRRHLLLSRPGLRIGRRSLPK